MQSLINLVDLLREDFRISVVCSAYDLGENDLFSGIQPDTWNEYKKNVSVFYTTGKGYNAVRQAISSCKPDIVYINGMFLPTYNWLPLILANKYEQKVVMSPRGMLQSGALEVKSFKKKVFLILFKGLGLHKNIYWHATDEQERIDIQRIFGLNAMVTVAFNITKHPILIRREKKMEGQLKIVFLSLIAEKKNLHVVLEALMQVKIKIQFHIYGPIKDKPYWRRCKQLITSQIHDIQYFGSVEPAEVQQKLAAYDVFVLPTKGENFGHAIYESLSVGTPVFVSQFTPWGRLQDSHAGLTVESFNPADWAKAIQTFIDLDKEDYESYSRGAYNLAKDYFSRNDFKAQYQNLFS